MIGSVEGYSTGGGKGPLLVQVPPTVMLLAPAARVVPEPIVTGPAVVTAPPRVFMPVPPVMRPAMVPPLKLWAPPSAKSMVRPLKFLVVNCVVFRRRHR